MPKLSQSKIDEAISKAKRDGKDVRLWDDSPKGLGVRVKPSGTATFFVQYTSPVTFKKVRHTLDQYGKITLEQARKNAKSVLGSVADGEDPNLLKKDAKRIALEAVTVSEFCDDYLKDAKAGLVTYRGKAKKARTLGYDVGRIERHIKPTLGDKLVRDVTRRDVERAMHSIRQGKTKADIKIGPGARARVTGGAGAAVRAISLLGSIFTYAIKLGIRDDNPVSGVERPKDGKRERYLQPKEYKALGKALNALESEGYNKHAIHAARVLALTGCRKSEVLSLKRDDIDAHSHCLVLRDTKTGAQSRPIGEAALRALGDVPGDGDFVFPATRGEGHLIGMKAFDVAVERAKLEGVTLHTLRHSFASVGLELEYSEMTIGGLLGHRLSSVTARYSHHVDRALVAAADRISAVIAGRLEGKNVEGAKVYDLKRVRR